MNACPHCRLPMAMPGRFIEARDDAGLFVVFPVCMRCRLRLDRLPAKVQRRLQDAAFRNLAAHSERYEFATFSTAAEARIFCALSAEADA